MVIKQRGSRKVPVMRRSSEVISVTTAPIARSLPLARPAYRGRQGERLEGAFRLAWRKRPSSGLSAPLSLRRITPSVNSLVKSKQLSYTADYSGLTGNATMAHFHGPADPGKNAGIVVPVQGSVVSPIKGTATLPPLPTLRPPTLWRENSTSTSIRKRTKVGRFGGQVTNAVNSRSTANPGAPVEGRNSFTEGQAKSRIEANGFADVSGLHKDDTGVWLGKAKKDGKTVDVALDFQ